MLLISMYVEVSTEYDNYLFKECDDNLQLISIQFQNKIL